MSENEFLNKILALFPDALIDHNRSTGEIVIETGLYFDGDEYMKMNGGR